MTRRDTFESHTHKVRRYGLSLLAASENVCARSEDTYGTARGPTEPKVQDNPTFKNMKGRWGFRHGDCGR